MMRRALERLILWLAPDHRKKWAQAMTAEMAVIENSRKAVAFALGCLIACCHFRLEFNIAQTGSRVVKDRFVILTFIAGVAAGLIGLAYLLVSGAPLTKILVNGGAIVIGILLAMSLRLSARATDSVVTAIALIGAFILFGTAIFGFAIEDARRWLLIGPFFIQTSLILLPLIAVSFARVQNFRTTVAVLVAAFAMAAQPDRAMAAMLFVAVAIVGTFRPNRLTVSAALFCTMTFATTLLLPDRLPAVPFVDHILWTAFDTGLWVGLMLWAGCLLLVCPIIFVAKAQRTVLHYVFASCWLTLIAAAAIGAYPTPIVGYGASAIIGYFLSLIFLQSRSLGRLAGDEVRSGATEADEAMPPLRNSPPYFAI
ncbi:MAG: hypothetical protein ACI9TB_001241 [Parasphingorhabdus sp.]|jgi:hypothetical protein|uniref:hypothetical protein n=1 Tax=Parasphingorhabdus sp. TaxID=2709688 RepID=UPI0039E648F0